MLIQNYNSYPASLRALSIFSASSFESETRASWTALASFLNVFPMAPLSGKATTVSTMRGSFKGLSTLNLTPVDTRQCLTTLAISLPHQKYTMIHVTKTEPRKRKEKEKETVKGTEIQNAN